MYNLSKKIFSEMWIPYLEILNLKKMSLYCIYVGT